jgi:hypothetical protein
MRRNILTYKAPPNNEGYDLICIHPDPRRVARQVELRQDEHPVIVIAGADIAAILVSAGMTTPEAVSTWLESEFGGKAEQ